MVMNMQKSKIKLRHLFYTQLIMTLNVMISWGLPEIQCHDMLGQNPCHDYSKERAPVMVTLMMVRTKI